MSEADSTPAATTCKRLAIIGGGSSGLICLKHALQMLPDWKIDCFEQSGSLTGAWGNPYPGFVSTSTKYTTQFASYPLFDAGVLPDGGASRNEFFREGEYGEYLRQFAERWQLTDHVSLHTRVKEMRRDPAGQGWQLTISQRGDDSPVTRQAHYDAVVVCTGLAAEPKQLECDVRMLGVAELTCPDGLGEITGQRIVVIGGGESAVDYANRLARPELNNQVFLSLKSGIRVSPRYHPIRGVPSDFLRNRLMLSIHQDIRNWIGQRFVEARIRYQETFERIFPAAQRSMPGKKSPSSEIVARRKEWTYKLTKAAKDDLFNMFHNKSDDFLNAVAEERITIVGEPVDRQFQRFRSFDSTDEILVEPDLAVPAIGYRAKLGELSAGGLQLSDFYLGSVHVSDPSVFLVGFARPVIGNIPSMSEMQARYVCGLLAGKFSRPAQIAELHQADITRRNACFRKLNLDAIFPVEMFPYCDQLARHMGCYPSIRHVGSLLAWCRMQLAPATTIHYQCDEPESRTACVAAPIYMPPLLIALLLALKPVDWVYRLCRR